MEACRKMVATHWMGEHPLTAGSRRTAASPKMEALRKTVVLPRTGVG